VLDGAGPAADDLVRLAGDGVRRWPSLDLPEHADRYREQVRAVATEVSGLPKPERRARLADTGYLVPHWPAPWGRDADTVENLVIEEEFAEHRVKAPNLGITGWVALTIAQHGTP